MQETLRCVCHQKEQGWRACTSVSMPSMQECLWVKRLHALPREPASLGASPHVVLLHTFAAVANRNNAAASCPFGSSATASSAHGMQREHVCATSFPLYSHVTRTSSQEQQEQEQRREAASVNERHTGSRTKAIKMRNECLSGRATAKGRCLLREWKNEEIWMQNM